MEIKEDKLRKELDLASVERATNNLKLLALIVVISSVIFAITGCFMFYKRATIAESKLLYIDSNGSFGSGVVTSIADKKVQEIQLKAAVKYAVPYLYQFNSATYDDRINTGLMLFGKSGKVIHTQYLKNRVREQVFQSNLEVETFIKEVKVTIHNKDVLGEVIFDQRFQNGDIEKSRSLKANFKIIKSSISDVNPFGVIIDDWFQVEL